VEQYIQNLLPVIRMRERRNEEDYRRLQHELQAGKVRPVYIFYGSEEFLLAEAVESLANALLPRGIRDNGCIRVGGSSTTVREIVSMASTPSLFSEKRLLIVDDAPYFGKERDERDTAELEKLATAEQNDSSCIVFCAREVLPALKAVKKLRAKGAVYRFDPLKTAALKKWVQERAAKRGGRFAPGALDVFLSCAGGDLRNLAMELEKLLVYLGREKVIDEGSILEVTVSSPQANIFALTDAAVYGRTAEALLYLKDLLAAGEPPLRILAMLVRQFRLLSEARDLLSAGEKNLARALKIHPYAAEQLLLQLKKTDQARLKRAVEMLVQCESDIKGGRIEPVLALETLLVALGN
jgi:DNA polymerase-3 subunit delta